MDNGKPNYKIIDAMHNGNTHYSSEEAIYINWHNQLVKTYMDLQIMNLE
jgi:hypothetical protein